MEILESVKFWGDEKNGTVCGASCWEGLDLCRGGKFSKFLFLTWNSKIIEKSSSINRSSCFHKTNRYFWNSIRIILILALKYLYNY